MTDSPASDVARIALLDNPVRAALYRLLARRDDWIDRDEAADAAGVPRPVAAFHLDKLSEAGLADVTYVRRSGRTGPGAGRPSKLYRRSRLETSVSIPERRYPLAGHLLAGAIEAAAQSAEPVSTVLHRLARKAGRELGAARSGGRGAPALVDALSEAGYEPRREGPDLALRNCPFHELAQTHTDLVCTMNLSLLRGMLEGIGLKATARLDPQPGWCCVRIAADRGSQTRARRPAGSAQRRSDRRD